MADYDPSGPPDMNVQQSDQNGQYTYDQQDDGDDDEDYDPSSFSFGDNMAETSAPQQQDTAMQDQAQPTATETSHAEQTTKPKTVGGFIIEESDEEEDDDEENGTPLPSQLNGAEGAQSGLGAVAVSEAASSAAGQDVSLASEPTQDSAAAQTAQASLNGSTAHTPQPPVSDHVATSSAVVFAPSLQAATADQGKDVSLATAGTHGAVSVSATPKPSVNGLTAPTDNTVPPTPTTQRLPHDKVGRLEDRIKEDPKADTQAWLELIAHYRDKDQIDNARKVYERMLEVFPTAVRISSFPLFCRSLAFSAPPLVLRCRGDLPRASVWLTTARTQPSIMVSYAKLELEVFDRSRIDAVFHKSLFEVPNVDLWNLYLDYLRRVLPLVPDAQGENRAIITSAFDTVLNNVGIDPDAGRLWREYIDFAKSGPGVVGGSSWQDQQKGDAVRRAYQRATKVPSGELVRMWKEYDNFEMANNKTQGRKLLQEQSPHYMSARTARNNLEKITDGLNRTSLPVLPPVHGYEGEEVFAVQVERWRAWIEFEISDPVAYKEEEPVLYRARVLYAFKQATMQLRFYPDIWFEAAQWCFEQLSDEMVMKGDDFLDSGLKANPESVLLALKKADRIESTLPPGNSDDVIVANGVKLDVPFENVHQALYGLREKMLEREKKGVQAIREHFASLPPEEETETLTREEDDDDDDVDLPNIEKPKTRQEQIQAQIQALTTGSRAHLEVLKRTISYVWVAKMRAFRRVQGQGVPNKPKKGFRGVFSEARPRGQLSSDVYIASALMEWHCYKDASALKIFERGLKLFPTDEVFALEYIRFLVGMHDVTNARVVFETTVTKILGPTAQQMQAQPPALPQPGKPETEEEKENRKRREKVRPLLMFMHDFESDYGESAQIQKLENRMKVLYPQEPEIARFGHRHAMPSFDGMQVELIISTTQTRPKTTFAGGMGMGMGAGMGQHRMAMRSVEGVQDGGSLRLGPNGPYVASPKRPLDDGDDNESPQRKFMRGDSPLKGAAGRRIQGGGLGHAATNSASGAGGGGGGFATKTYVPGSGPQTQNQGPVPVVAAGPPPLPREINFLLSILPHASTYHSNIFEPTRVVDFLRSLNLDVHRPRIMGMGGVAVGGGYPGR